MPGVRTWKFTPAGGATDNLAHLFPAAIGSPAVMVVRFKIQFTTLPNAIRTIVSDTGGGLCGIRYNSTGTKLEAWAGAATATFAGSFVPSTGVTYLIEARFTRGTTHTTEWQVDGAAQTTATKTVQSAATITGVTLGSNGTGSGGNANATATYYITDLCVSGTSGDYPLGTGTGVALWPTKDGTHTYADNSMSGNSGGPFQGPETTLYTHLHSEATPGLLSAVGVFLSQVVVDTGYLELLFRRMPAVTSINALTVISEHHGSTTGAHTQSLRLEDGATESVILALVDSSDLTTSYNDKCYAVAPSTSAAWTRALINALKIRWGYSNDVVGNPILDGVVLEVDYIIGGNLATVPPPSLQAVKRVSVF